MFDGEVGAPWQNFGHLTLKFSLMPQSRIQNAQDVLAAARCFKVRTGRGHDDHHPRWYALLSEECRQEVETFLNRLEEIGCWPEQLRHTLIKLIPKPKGGKRPVGLLTALVRLWERMRIREERQRKTTAFRDYNWAARGRSAQDAVGGRAYTAKPRPGANTMP